MVGAHLHVAQPACVVSMPNANLADVYVHTPASAGHIPCKLWLATLLPWHACNALCSAPECGIWLRCVCQPVHQLLLQVLCPPQTCVVCCRLQRHLCAAIGRQDNGGICHCHRIPADLPHGFCCTAHSSGRCSAGSYCCFGWPRLQLFTRQGCLIRQLGEHAAMWPRPSAATAQLEAARFNACTSEQSLQPEVQTDLLDGTGGADEACFRSPVALCPVQACATCSAYGPTCPSAYRRHTTPGVRAVRTGLRVMQRCMNGPCSSLPALYIISQTIKHARNGGGLQCLVAVPTN